jgi:hypothetical protein
MDGSQKTELTRKKGAYVLPTSSFGFQKMSRLIHCSTPTTANTIAINVSSA